MAASHHVQPQNWCALLLPKSCLMVLAPSPLCRKATRCRCASKHLKGCHRNRYAAISVKMTRCALEQVNDKRHGSFLIKPHHVQP